ncbi:MAG: cupin domain-containing protein [Methanobacterium sp.]
MEIGNNFENGTIYGMNGIIQSEEIPFIPHAKFKGVSLKHLVTGEKTNHQISCHLVKVSPFCTLDTHTHENNLEIHEIIYGNGTFSIADTSFSYQAGSIGIIPANIEHKVLAGDKGLYILAKFIPALL